MNPRVVHVASGREWRGGQNQVFLLARALAALGGIDQTVVTGRHSILAERLKAAGVRVHDTGWGPSLDPRAALSVWRSARPGPVILHAHDSHALTLAILAAGREDARLVATRRVDFCLRHPASWKRPDRVVAVSGAVERTLHSHGIPPEKVVVVHSGVAVEEMRRTIPLGIRPILGLPDRSIVAANVAALVRDKDQSILVEAAARTRERLPDLHWVIAGEGPRRGDLERQISSRGLDEHVHLMGHIRDAHRLTADADLFVMCSSREGLGTSILDAMALKVPVVATRAGGIPEMLDSGAGALVPVGDAEGLAREVVRLLTDPLAREKIQAVQNTAIPSWSDVRMAESMRQVYRSLSVNG